MNEPTARTDTTHGRPPGERGFSLLEVVIAATILFTILAIAGRFLQDSNSLLGTISARSETDVKASFLADRIARSFRNASLDSFRPYYGWAETTPTYHETYSTNGYTFQYCYLRNIVDHDNGKPVLGDAYFYYAFYGGESNTLDGIDNDGDQRRDEMEIRECHMPASAFTTTDNPQEIPVWNYWMVGQYTKLGEVSYYWAPPAVYPTTPPTTDQNGLTFKLNGRVLTVKVTMPKWDTTLQRQVHVSAEASVKLRN